MPNENRINLIGNYNTKEMKAYMLFEVYTDSDYSEEWGVEFSCYEDMEFFFKLYFEGNWKELFYDNKYKNKWVAHANFKGIFIKGESEEKGAKISAYISGDIRGNVQFDTSKHDAVNAKKIEEIRKVINK